MTKSHSDIALKDLDAEESLAPAEVSELDLYQKREKIYTRKIEGLFQRIRLLTGWPLLLAYFLLPWISWGNHQAVLFDLPERKFHILFMTFWPQDFPLLAGLLIIAAFGLFTVTNFAGRIWCGYTCPQTIWTAIFMWAEQFAEGSRTQRIKLDQQSWSWTKFRKKALKHTMWIGFAFLTGFTFIAYFIPSSQLANDFIYGNAGTTAYAWIVFFTLATYINAGALREQVCLHMCPYARFQSAMFDQDTLVISYDKSRGDPRGSRKRNALPSQQTDAQSKPLGDCIDCQICVQVCPTGIDIRNGLQYECIGCALCIDACDSVMEKMHYPKGLIRYTTEKILTGGETRIFRTHLIAYASVLLIMVGLFGARLFTRSSIELDVIRDRQNLYSLSSQGMIENIYTLKMINMTNIPHWFVVDLEGMEQLEFLADQRYWIEAGAAIEQAIRLRASPDSSTMSISPIQFRLYAEDDEGLHDVQESRFISLPDKTARPH